ncbi:hypothetical protein Taro_006220 [Colocasia esculenta]|uniref:Uncharacterized protein n=1 Tax=Colocasia esculenta TaxID=4460 RepID=A0A843U018_COLES|nr:hypothetical protein [Colocasia esculenta]
MAVAFTRASWWLIGRGGKDARREPNSSPGPSAASSQDADSVRFPQGQAARVRSARPRPRWQSREERRRRAVDREFDLVLVPSDGGLCWSGSDSDDSDWSIGWLEPHAPGFLPDSGDGDSETGSFAVLVPCYGRGRCDRGAAAAGSSPNRDRSIGAMDLVDGYSSDRFGSLED